jgi:hypothetical protein
MEYTVPEVRELVAGLPVLKIGAGAASLASEVERIRDAMEGVEQLVSELPPHSRVEALIDDCDVVGRNLWVPVLNNCRLSAGLSVAPGGEISFAVKGSGEGLVEYFSARDALRHALSGAAEIPDDELPAPEHNGADSTRNAATPRSVPAPDAAGCLMKDVLPEDDATEADGTASGDARGDAPGDADVDRDDVAADGLAQPAGGGTTSAGWWSSASSPRGWPRTSAGSSSSSATTRAPRRSPTRSPPGAPPSRARTSSPSPPSTARAPSRPPRWIRGGRAASSRGAGLSFAR